MIDIPRSKSIKISKCSSFGIDSGHQFSREQSVVDDTDIKSYSFSPTLDDLSSTNRLFKTPIINSYQPAREADNLIHQRENIPINLSLLQKDEKCILPYDQWTTCACSGKHKYLISNKVSTIQTDTSTVEFAIKLDNWQRVAFKTISDPEIAKREYDMFQKLYQRGIKNVSRPIDAFKNPKDDSVFVFNRLEKLDISSRNLSDIASVVYQLLSILKDLHKNKILHLDVNPSNLMTKTGSDSEIVLIDFGLAHDLSIADSLPRRGTPGFIAPELIENMDYDGRADVYSVGIVLGMMLLNFFPTVDLRLLGSPNVTCETIETIVSQIDQFFSLLDYEPTNIVDHKSSPSSSFDESRNNKNLSAEIFQSSTHTYADDDDTFINSFYKNSMSVNQMYSYDSDDLQKPYAAPSSFSSFNRIHSYSSSHSVYSSMKPQNAYSKQYKELSELVPSAVLHAADLLKLLLKENPEERPTAEEALNHPLFSAFREPHTTGKSLHRAISVTNFGNQDNIDRSTSLSSSKLKRFEETNTNKAEFFKDTRLEDLHTWCDKVSSYISESINNTRAASPMSIYHNFWE